MSRAGSEQPRAFGLLTTGRHDCPYLPDRTACTQFVDPRAPMGPVTYEQLLLRGFRRSGPHLYRPTCPGCSECRSLRIDVTDFSPRRRHRRCLRDNADLDVRARPPRLTAEQAALFQRYLAHRHPDGEMADSDPESFLCAPWCDTLFYEFRDAPDGELLLVAVTDLLPNGLSAVYTFFEPEPTRRSLGTLGILWQISEARRMGLQHVYLGYWIASAAAMGYKADFRPHELHCPTPADARRARHHTASTGPAWRTQGTPPDPGRPSDVWERIDA